jgi:hypothetical protein
MPLTARKIAHIKANLVKIFAGRTQQVLLTIRNADGSTTTLPTLNAIWRAMEDQDPIYDPAGTGGDDIKVADVVALFNLADISYSQMRQCVWAELVPGQPGPAIATRYLPTSITPKGIIPGGDRLIVTFDRQR